jgi:purine-nucleoside phosphorylase
MPMNDEFILVESAASFILSQTHLRPRIGLVLGSGFGGLADELSDSSRLPYAHIPAFPRSTAIGHPGNMVIGKCAEVPVAAMQGRIHLYEGYSARQVGFPVRVLARMGIRALILTNAAGAINPEYEQGSLVLIRDHINLQGTNPLVGPNDQRFGPRFPDMTTAYWRPYREIAQEEARRLGQTMREGVYAALLGPSYETPAEIRFLRTIGADLVGMSTVPEVIVAQQMGLKVLAISCVTNTAAGIVDEPLNHEKVLETAEGVRNELGPLLRAIIRRSDESLEPLQQRSC